MPSKVMVIDRRPGGWYFDLQFTSGVVDNQTPDACGGQEPELSMPVQRAILPDLPTSMPEYFGERPEMGWFEIPKNAGPGLASLARALSISGVCGPRPHHFCSVDLR